jgi:NADH dehydrogenase FAD-containing subunit
MSNAELQQHTPPSSLCNDAQTPRPVSKVPTGLGAEPLNVVILGASYAGLAVAHRFLDETVNQLRISKAAPNYRLIVINPSTHFYWNIGAPRALVRPGLIQHDDLFLSIEEGFHRHRAHNLSIVQGEAVAMDPSARTLTVELIGSTAQKRASQINKRESRLSGPPNSKMQTIPYHALIMATGTSTHSDVLGLHGPHLNTIGTLNTLHARLVVAKSIIVCGGGCSGVETVGQLATYLNYRTHWPFRKRVKHPKKIILLSGSTGCLPCLKPNLGAEKMLKSVGVEIRHNVRVIAAKQDFDLTGATKVELNDDTSLIADVYIPCTGVEPNTAYVPPSLKDAKGYILTNPSTLRCDEMDAGPRVYAIGDCAAYSHNCIQDVYAAVPTLMRNLLNDLLAHEYRLASPYGGNQDKIDELQDLRFQRKDSEMVLCPISRSGGVGTWKGRAVPKFLVHLLKGHDYRLGRSKRVVEYGSDPYA